jgi:hypothetical protein
VTTGAYVEHADEEPGAASRGSRLEGAPARWSEVRKTGMRKTGEKEAAV